MIVDKKLILQLANLAKLSVTEQEIQSYIPQIQKVLDHFEELNSLNTDNIEPLITPVQIAEYHREDQVDKTISTDELIQLAPDKVGKLIKVPPVI